MVERGVPELDSQLNSLVGRVSDIERRLREMTDVTAPLDTSVRGKEYATVVIAAANTRDGKSRANVVCSGNGDDETIRIAIMKYCPVETESGHDVIRGRVLLLEGDYHFSGYSLDVFSGFPIECSGFDFAGIGHATIIHTGEAAVTGSIAFAAGIRGASVRDLWIKTGAFDGGYGVSMFSPAATGGHQALYPATPAVIDNVVVEDCHQTAFKVAGAGAVARGCMAWGAGDAYGSGTVIGFALDDTGSSAIDCRVDVKDSEAFGLWQFAISAGDHSRILGCDISGAADANGRAIFMSGQGNIVANNLIHDSFIDPSGIAHNPTGAAISDSGNGPNTISNNRIRAWQAEGIDLLGGGPSIVKGNSVISEGVLPSPVPTDLTGIFIGSDEANVEGNTVRGEYDYGLWIAGNGCYARDNDVRNSGSVLNYNDTGIGTDTTSDNLT